MDMIVLLAIPVLIMMGLVVYLLRPVRRKEATQEVATPTKFVRRQQDPIPRRGRNRNAKIVFRDDPFRRRN